mgnify:CR=1 FL=1|jgi:hypothetical protein
MALIIYIIKREEEKKYFLNIIKIGLKTTTKHICKLISNFLINN